MMFSSSRLIGCVDPDWNFGEDSSPLDFWSPEPQEGTESLGCRAVVDQTPAVHASARTHPRSTLTDCAPMSHASVGCILRAPGRPVDLDRYPLGEGSRFDQV